MKVYKFFINFEKEEKWLKSMAQKGWQLCGKTFAYRFCKIDPSEIDPSEDEYRIDYQSFRNARDMEDYKLLFKDSGWAHVAGSRYSGVQYFRKINQNSNSDIFSDSASKALRYKKLSSMWIWLAVPYIPILIALISTKALDFSAIINPKLLYYTPQLWEKTGAEFWKSFLFETPFVCLRLLMLIALPLLVLFSLISYLKAEKLYRKTKEEKFN